MKDNTFLGTEKTGKLLFKLAVPAVTAQLVNLLYNLVDRIYIGHIAEIGTEALTGVGVCLPIIMLISAFAYLVGSGGAPRASIFMGSGDNDTAEKILGNCFTLLLGVSVVLTVVFYVWNEPLLMAFGASEKTVGYGVEYMAIYALGTIFVLMALGLNVFITAQGFTVVSILSSIMMFCMMPLQGITQGAQPIVSYNFGAKNTERVKQTFKYTFIACCAYTVLLWAVVQIFPKTVAMAFSSDAELIAYTARALRIYMAVSCVFGAQIACQQTFVAIGKAGISFFLAVLRKILLLLPLIYIMPAVFAGDPATAIYAAEPVADFLAVATTVTCFTVLFGRAMKKLDKERAEEQAAAVTEADGND